MKALQHTRVAMAISPGVIKDDAAFTSNVLDRRDFPGMSYGEFHVLLGSIDATAAAFKVQKSDTKTNDTTLGGTPADIVDVTTKPGASDDDEVWIIGIDFSASHERYFQLQITAGNGAAGTYAAAVFVGERIDTAGTDATARNAGSVSYV